MHTDLFKELTQSLKEATAIPIQPEGTGIVIV